MCHYMALQRQDSLGALAILVTSVKVRFMAAAVFAGEGSAVSEVPGAGGVLVFRLRLQPLGIVGFVVLKGVRALVGWGGVDTTWLLGIR